MRTCARGLLAGALGLAAAVAIGPYLIRLPPRTDALPPDALADPDSRFASAEGIRVHHRVRGSGRPALLLLHGFAASTFSWRKVLGPLGRLGTAIAYDRPGFGLTARPAQDWGPAGASPYALTAQPALALALLERLGHERAILIGHSAGAAVAVLTALACPSRVEALVLVAPAVGMGPTVPAAAQRLLRTGWGRRVGTLATHLLDMRAKAFLQRAYSDPAAIQPEDLAGYLRPLRSERWEEALWEVTLGAGAGLGNRLTRVAVPTLVMTGDGDRVVSPAHSHWVARRIPGAELAVVEGCGHLPQEECPEAFLLAVQGFLRRL